MTELEARKKILEVADSFYGYSESSGKHKQIIDLYNAHKPLAVGYKVKYTDAWCATFGSAVAIKAGMTDIIPTECSCERQIALWKKLGRWHENENYTPKPGDYIYYDWGDKENYASTDNIGNADHVGIVYEVKDNNLTIIEGNYKNSVGYRYLKVNGRYIRGYGLPDYASLESKKEIKTSMDYIVKPAKIQIYLNTSRKTKEQVQTETGCAAIMNGGLYDMSKWAPVAQLKANGKQYVNENWGINYGLAWNGNCGNLTIAKDMAKFDNYLGCVGLVYDSNAVKLNYPKEMDGVRPRTAIGVMPDGKLWMYINKPGLTPAKLQQIALASGCKSAIMLDGGASTQAIFPDGVVSSDTRPVVQNYICVWIGEEKQDAPKPTPEKVVCPYAEPTTTIKTGSVGDGARWVQWMLVKALNITDPKFVDGIFLSESVAALYKFQAKYPECGVDKKCGPKTRAKLKEVVGV